MGLLIAAEVAALVAMVCVSIWGMRRVPPEARIRARAGATGLDWTMGKNAALWTTPLVGLGVLLGTLAMRDAPDPETMALLGVAVMLILLAAHTSSIRRAAR